MRTQPTVTQVNTIQRCARTSLLEIGEVRSEPRFENVVWSRHGSQTTVHDVVGDSRLSRGNGREDGIPQRTEHWQQCRLGVRAAIVAQKRGNARGAKGGRKVNRD
jgi:hypothetical protein